MLLLAGSVPDTELRLVHGRVSLKEERFFVGEEAFSLNRGTPSMIGTAAIVCRVLGINEPYCVLAGDTGRGGGSKLIYNFLKEKLKDLKPTVCAFHYIMPDLVSHEHVFSALKKLQKKPFLIADAGYMYIAKMSGRADFYDLFTPDVGELAFLADENSPHPFYTRGFIFHRTEEVEDFILRAYKSKNAPRFLLVKGFTDFICEEGRVLKKVNSPDIDVLECIGGTGDTITGMTAALISAGHQPSDACYISAAANRLAGALADPTPATQVREIIRCIPEALKIVLHANSGI